MRWIVALSRWAVLTALYLALAGEGSVAEIVAGVLTGFAGLLLALALHAMTERPFALRAPWRRLLPRLAFALLRDASRVAIALAKAIPAGGTGWSQSRPLAASGEDAAGAGHRALVILLASIAPNGFVTGIGERALRLHRLAPAATSADPEWPV